MDRTILEFFNESLCHPAVDVVMSGVTFAGFPLLPLLGAILLIPRRTRRIAIALTMAMAGTMIAAVVLQFVVMRPRPEDVRLVVATPSFSSFPSGHAAISSSVAVLVSLTYRRIHYLGSCVAVALLISASGIYLGHHFPSDVLGGIIVGASIGLASYGLIISPNPGIHWLLWPQVALALIATEMAYLDLLPRHLLDWPFSDKVLHFLLFGAITFWLNLWLGGRSISCVGWRIPLAIVLPLSIAATEEAMQMLSPARTASSADLACDILGMTVFWYLSTRLAAGRESREPTNACRMD